MGRTQRSLCVVRTLLSLVVMIVLATAADASFQMSLIHTQDTYGAVVAVEKNNAACAPFANGTYKAKCYGGMGRRMTYIRNAMTTEPHVLLLDTGNFLSDSPLEEAGGTQNLGKFYSELGYAVLKLGDHDMARPEELAQFLSAVPNATVVSSNLINYRNDSALSGVDIQPYAIYEFGDGERVGICGGVGQNIRVKVNRATPMNSTDEISALKAAVGSMANKGVTRIIASIYDESLVPRVINEIVGIDVLVVHAELYITSPEVLLNDQVFGHYPTVYEVPWGQPVLVVGTGSYGKYIGHLKLVFDDFGVITNWTGDSYVLTSSYPEDPAIKDDVVTYYSDVVNALYTTQLGEAAVNISFEEQCLFTQCTIGSWQADVLREATGTDIGMVNSGSLGGGWQQGPIMAIDVQTVVKYGTDYVYTLSVTGAELLVALENSVSKINTGRFMQLSGIKIEWNVNEPVGWRVVNAWIIKADNKRQNSLELISNTTRYTISLFDFIANGGDDYFIFATNATDVVNTGSTIFQIVLRALDNGPVTPALDSRIVASSARRLACLAADGTLCNNNGQCLNGACQCNSGTSGALCEPSSSSSSGSDNTTAIVLGTVLPVIFVFLVIAVLIGFLVWAYMKYKQPKLILKEPNYQMLVWRRESLDVENKASVPKSINSKVSALLEKFLLDKHVVKALSGVVRADRTQMDEVSAAMVLVHQSANKGTKLIKTLLKHELLSEDERVLFRQETLGLKSFSVFSRMVGLPYLWYLFAYPIAELDLANSKGELKSPRPRTNVSDGDPSPLSIFLVGSAIELNPRMMEEGEDDSIGRLELELIIQKLFSRITDSVNHFPLYLRQLCHMLYKDMRYDHPDYIHRVLGNLIFLRFICPSLIVPQSYGLVKDHTHAKTQRALILIAKVLQNLANKNDFSGKEQFMESMNGFIHRNIKKMESFFDELSVPADEPKFGDPPTSIVPRQFRKKSLALMYQFVQNNSKQIHSELAEFPAYAVKETLELLRYLTQDVNSVEFAHILENEDDEEDVVETSSSDEGTSDENDELERGDDSGIKMTTLPKP